MISFRAISATIDGDSTARYFLNKQRPLEDKEAQSSPEASSGTETGGDPRNDLVDYYTGHGAAGVRWRKDMAHSAAKALGIDPRHAPTPQQLGRLYEGKLADTGEQWAGNKREISAYDFTFSPHKSVTLAAEFAKSPAETAAIRAAISRANDDAMRYIAQEIGWARKGKAGLGGADPGETGWVSYSHYDARPTLPIKDGRYGETTLHEAPVPGDPQDHIHNTLFNLVLTEDGRAGSLDTKRLRSRVHEFGAYGQARLAEELRKLGIRVAYDEKHEAAVIPAIPQTATETFSKSRQQILRAARADTRRQGLDWNDLSADDKLKTIAGAASAARLSKHDTKSDRELWRTQAEAIGWEHKTVFEEQFPAPLPDEQRFERAYTFAASRLAEEFHTAGVIDHDRLRTYAARGLIGTGATSPQDIDRVVDILEDRGLVIDGGHASLIKALTKKSGNRKDTEMVLRVTTSAHLKMEQELIAHIQRAAASKTATLTKAEVDAAIAASGLHFDSEHGASQIAATRALGQGGTSTLLTGAAGSGKTTLLRPLVAAWKGDRRASPGGRNIFGVSTAWKQARALQDAGIDKTVALDPFLKSIAAGDIKANPNTILVIDEVSQIGVKSMLDIFRLQEKTGMTIVALGDREQAQAIEAGDTIELMRRALPRAARPEILTTVRQITARDRKIASLFRKEEAAKALDMKRDDGTAKLVGGDYDQVVEAIASLYLSRRDALRAADPCKTITISVPTNEDAAEISRAVRARLTSRGEIGTDEAVYQAITPRSDGKDTLFNLPIATGDRVRLYKLAWAKIGNKYDAIGHNGDVVEVVRRTDTHIYLKDAKGRTGEVEWQRLMDRRSGRLLLGFGHALTIDSAQGITSDEHINALPRGSTNITGFKAYVAESRARGTTWTMVSEAAVREVEKQRRPLGDRREITRDDLWKRIAEDMAHKPYKGLAIDLAKAAGTRSHKAADSFLRQSHALHSWQEAGRDVGRTARDRAHDKTLSARLSGRLSELSDAIRQNSVLLRDALIALQTYINSKRARATAAPQPSPREEPAPSSSPSPRF